MVDGIKVVLSDCAVICAAGATDTLLQGLQQDPTQTLSYSKQWLKNRGGYFGFVDLPEQKKKVTTHKTNRLLAYCADQMVTSLQTLKKKIHSERIGIILGTTTTGINAIENDMYYRPNGYHLDHELSSCARFLAEYIDISGPAYVVSTACTSGAKALGLARELVLSGWCDAVIAGGSESLTRMTCQGFDALESYSQGLSTPFQATNDGINIGEGAALFIVKKGQSGVTLAGFGESSDAYHESAPDPQGIGAEIAINQALQMAGCRPNQIDYINLHGTGTRLNDSMESKVIHRMFGEQVPTSSVKPVIGHTLGAAGAVEAAILWLLLQCNGSVKLPPHVGAEHYNPALPPLKMVHHSDPSVEKLNHVLSTSFAFGGHNTALVLQRQKVE